MNVKIKDLITKYNIIPKKSLGQNFIFDYNILDKITKSLLPLHNNTVIEIGSGPGGLTRSILKYGPERLIVVERDISYKEILKSLISDFKQTNILFLFKDFLQMNLKEYSHQPIKIYSNLPYNISTQILIKILPLHEYNIQDVVFTFQKEVAQRILALPNTKKYSRLSVLCQYSCKVKKICTLPAKVFFPEPKIESMVIKLKPNTNVCAKTFYNLKKLTKKAFGKRRKILKNSLYEFSELPQVLKELKIKETARAENLTIEQFVSLSKRIQF